MREKDRRIVVDSRRQEESVEAEEPGPLLLELTFTHCRVQVHTNVIQTIFEDGTKVVTCPPSSPEERHRAAVLGYGDDVGALGREHEILRTWLAEAHGLPYSPTLWSRAHRRAAASSDSESLSDWSGEWIGDWIQQEENEYVFLFQAYLNGQEAAARELPGIAPVWREECLRLLRSGASRS